MKFSNISPLGAFGDLRNFLAGRQKHEWRFALAAFVVTGFIVWAFIKDSRFERVYKREIIYAESWPLNRSDAEIKAQQAIDGPKEKARKDEYDRKVEERRKEFQQVNDKLKSWGI